MADASYWINFLSQRELVSMINVLVNDEIDHGDSVRHAVWQVLFHSRVENDWIADARHFKWQPIGGRRPDSKFIFYSDWLESQDA
jgi:hypothetical protein